MITYIFILLLIYIISTYLFSKLRVIWNFVTMIMGVIFIVNDFNNTIISDDTMKLSFMLSFIMYCFAVFLNVYTTEDAPT